MIPQHSRRFSVLLSLLVPLLLIVSPPARNIAFSAIRFPFTALRWSIRTLILIPQLPQLARRQQGLQERLAESELEIAHLREALRGKEQEEVLSKVVPGRRGILAPTLGRSLMVTQHTLLLGKGRRSGIIADSVVLTGDGMIGRVVETHAESALVVLLTDPESRVAAMVERSHETGLVVGRGRPALELIYLDADADVQEGDRVVTAGLGRAYPKGLLLGTVTHVNRAESSGEAVASIKPSARLGFLEDVLCLPPAAEGAP